VRPTAHGDARRIDQELGPRAPRRPVVDGLAVDLLGRYEGPRPRPRRVESTDEGEPAHRRSAVEPARRRRRVREVHANTIEGFWLGLRNYLRPFRGVSKWCLYLAFYEGIHNDRRDFLGFLRRLLGPFTPSSP
jgi:hypothetical protein